MKWLGEDVSRARSGWLYDPSAAQPLWLALLFTLLLLVLHVGLQMLGAALTFRLSGGDISALQVKDPATVREYYKSAVVGLLPAGLIITACALIFARFKQRSAKKVLALHMPDIGIGGWATVVLSFILFILIANFLIFTMSGLNATDYLPTGQGAGDAKSSSGLVEKAIADLADEPLMFWSAVPAVVLFIPITEELIFRGSVFSALLKSGAGKPATVILTSAAWAMLHGFAAPWLFVALIFVMGVSLGVILLRFGSLWVPIVCHCVWNALTTFTIISAVSS
jgi:membrane protease YdiL (CAAX protease family)